MGRSLRKVPATTIQLPTPLIATPRNQEMAIEARAEMHSDADMVGKRDRPVKPRSVVPIRDTIESIRGYPNKLVIFRVPASPFWWMRYFDGRPIKRSTKTTVKAEAISAAKAFYEELLVNKKLGVSNNPKKSSFALCADAVIAEDKRKAERGELN